MCSDVTTYEIATGVPCQAPNAAGCECNGCGQAQCFLDVDDPTTYSDCTCPECAADAFCSDPNNCQNDGVCDPFLEGCVCADCADHPQCP
jgi:hypothetical protein